MSARFVEELHGTLVHDVGTSHAFACELDVEVPEREGSSDADGLEAAIVGGNVDWSYLGTPARIGTGYISFFRARPSSPTVRSIVYRFQFIANGREYLFEGEKRLTGSSPSDAATELSTVHASVSSAGRQLASGTLVSALDELLNAYEGAAGDAPSTSDEARAFERFDAFLNQKLTAIYPHLPALLKAGDRSLDGLRRVLKVLAMVLLPDPLPADGPSVMNVVDGIERFLDNASGKQAQAIRTLLQVISIFVPVLEQDIEAVRDKVRSLLAREKKSLIRQVLGGLHQMVVFAYYAHPRADRLLGYRRPRHDPNHHTTFPVSSAIPKRTFDVVIAGSGPAGALLADRLSAQGKSVLVLEAGRYIPERDITADELDSIARLYKNSGLQAAKKPSSVTILQGACVGGGGVINNGIFFPVADATLKGWRNVGFPFDRETMAGAYGAVATELNIGDVATKARRLNPAAVFLEGQFGPPQSPPAGPVPPGFYRMMLNLETLAGDGELTGCRSTGLCNLGCGSERKVNGFQQHLRNALDGTRDVVLVPDAAVSRVVMGAGATRRRVIAFEVRLADGTTQLAHGESFVLCCGAIGSSAVLLRSDALPDRRSLPVGRRFCGNVASPVFATAPSPVNDEPYVQMCHVLVPEAGDNGFLIETWFSPPGGLALAMPGFLDTHARRMGNYQRLISSSPVVGTRPVGRITLRRGDPVIDLPLAPVDLNGFCRGMSKLVCALLDGAAPVIVRLGNGRAIETEDDLKALVAELQRITPDDLHLLPMSTAHPQGGNALSDDVDIGVVQRDFRVRGTDNLRVCDGSVFPSGADVNPQWTILALAHLCAIAME